MKEYSFSNRSLLDRIIEYKYLIAFITVLTILLCLVYISVADKVYRSDATIEIVPKESLLEVTRVNPSKNSDYERYFQTQMDFLRSRSLVSKVVKDTNSNIKYYTKNSLGLYHSYEGELPIEIDEFKIKEKSFYKKYFRIRVLDDKRYELSLLKKSFLFDEFSKPLVCNFGDKIITNYIDFKISKKDILAKKDIYITVLPVYYEVSKAIKRLSVVRSSDKSSFLKISYDDTSAFRAKKFLDSLISIYSSIIQKGQKSEVKNYSTVLDEEIKKLKEKLDENEKELLNFSTKNKTAGITKQTDNIVDTIKKDKDRLKDLQMKYQTLRTILVMVKDTQNYENILTLLADIDNKNLPILINGILEEQKIYEKKKEKYTDLHPSMVELKRSIKTRKIALKKNLIELYKSVRSQLKELQSSIKNQESALTQVPSKEMGLAKLKREHDRLEKEYLALLDKKSKIKLSQKIEQDYIVRVVDRAYIPTYHIKPKGVVLLALSLILGVILGIFAALVRDFFRKKIVVPSDVEENSFIPLIGTITKIKERILYNSLFVLRKPDLIASKMVWELRNSVERYKKSESGMVISVTSMIRGEGKTTICANLAAALSQGDKSVIVVSLDLRLPQIHRKFDISNRYGITSVVFDKVDINRVIKKVRGQENLYFLPTGPIPKSPMKVINSKFMDLLMKELRKSFDYIVVDLAPLSVAPESILMLKRSDLNIAVLKSNYSDKKFISFIEDIVKKNDIKNVAFVLNALDQKYVKTISRKENNLYVKSSQLLNSNF